MLLRKKIIFQVVMTGVLPLLVGCSNKEGNTSNNKEAVEVSQDNVNEIESDNNYEEKENQDDSNSNNYYSDDEEINICIKDVLLLDSDRIVEYGQWIDDNQSVYRISVGRTEEIDDEYSHLEDYFFIKSSDGVKYFKVDYPSKNDPIDSDRYVCDACDFTAYFEDVTFDGENDIVISLGHQGASGTEVHCAYVYIDGEYVYTKSFEEIPNYQIDNDNKCIVGEYDGEEYKYIFQNGEFVQK